MPTILCVDDHVGTLQTLTLLLQFAGYKCLSAATADEAGFLFQDNAVDLLIVDQGLPGIAGEVLAGQLKARRPVRVIMLTGDTSLERAPASVDVLLHKPYPPEDFLRAIADMTSPRTMAAAS